MQPSWACKWLHSAPLSIRKTSSMGSELVKFHHLLIWRAWNSMKENTTSLSTPLTLPYLRPYTPTKDWLSWEEPMCKLVLPMLVITFHLTRLTSSSTKWELLALWLEASTKLKYNFNGNFKEMLEFSANHNVYPLVETFSFEDFPKAVARLEHGKPIFRCVVNVIDWAKANGFEKWWIKSNKHKWVFDNFSSHYT